MRLPYMTAPTTKTKRQIIAFGGVNYGLGTGDGELLESFNLSSSRYPCLSQRDGRKTAAAYTAPTGLYARGKLCVVDGTDFIYGGSVVGKVSAGEKQFATINTKIVVFPDKVFYDTQTGQFGHLAAEYRGNAGDVTFTGNTLTVPEGYPDFTEVFKAGDAVEITGCTTCPNNNGSHIIRSVSAGTLTFTEDIFTQTGTEAGAVLLERKVPDLTCICESDNRIWGAEGATIYASALGDPTNFFVYDGLATDSYAVAVGSDGEFTGCIAYGSAVLFWKENCVHKVLGSYPAQYELYTYTVPGVQAGSEKSLKVINETLFYKGRNGIYAYSGGMPELISANFGIRRFSNAVAGSDGQRYYISMKEDGGGWGLYVLDVPRGIWLREDDTRAVDFSCLDGVLYYLDGATGKLMMAGQDDSEEGRVHWSATLCQMDETTHGRKGYSKLYLRADMAAGSWLKVEVSPDGAPFRQVFSTHDERAKTIQVPILPTRCDNFRIRLSGRGACIIKSIVREFAVGSEY